MPDIYDGQVCVGSVAALEKGFAARDAAGKRLGAFTTRIEAVDACFRHARKTAIEPDADELIAGVERFMRGDMDTPL